MALGDPTSLTVLDPVGDAWAGGQPFGTQPVVAILDQARQKTFFGGAFSQDGELKRGGGTDPHMDPQLLGSDGVQVSAPL